MSDDERDLEARVAEQYRREVSASDQTRQRLDERLRAEPPPSRRLRGTFRGLLSRPGAAAWTLAATLLVALGIGSAWWIHVVSHREPPPVPRSPRVAPLPEPPSPGGLMVRFVCIAPQARQVALVGDFNGWEARASVMRREGERWILELRIPPGRHAYAFLVDGTAWINDPAAPMTPRDAYGFRKSILLVGGLAERECARAPA